MVYNPFTGYTVTGTWEEHISRGSLGGIDYAMPVGTPLASCDNATIIVTPYNGTGGHTVTMVRALGIRTQYMHLSHFSVPDGYVAKQGEIIGLSGGAAGADGSGSSTGPHVHAHDIDANGNRIPPFSGSSGNTGNGDNDMTGKLWRYVYNFPNDKSAPLFEFDHTRMVGRELKGWEKAGAENDIDFGGRRVDILGEPEWTNTFKHFRFVSQTTPEPIGGSATIDQAALDKAVADAVAKSVPSIATAVSVEMSKRLQA
jgi:murein DD-endopeptidase MepM/ murein hydrolase activator NlpD